MDWITAFDFSILDWIQQNLRCSWADSFFALFTHLADAGALWIALAVLFLCIPKTRRLGLALTLALILDALACNVLMKPLAARVRPYDRNPAVELLVAPPGDYSFPSGHTAVSFAAVAALAFSRSRHWIWALAVALLIAFSRLYLYLHYPTDVLGGMLVGLLAGFGGAWLAKKLRQTGKLDRFCPP